MHGTSHTNQQGIQTQCLPGCDCDGSIEDHRRQGHVEVGAVVEHVKALRVGRHLGAELAEGGGFAAASSALQLRRDRDLRAHLAEDLLGLQLGVPVGGAARKNLVFLK